MLSASGPNCNRRARVEAGVRLHKVMSTEQNEGGGFLSRWSRRKAQAQQEPAVVMPASTTAVAPAAAVSPTASAALQPDAKPMKAEPEASPPASDASASTPVSVPPKPKPTLDDVEQLDAKSDYRAFVARDVDPDVRNAAFKKLFHSDPHFNVMDGLDVYIDDYNTPNPLPVAVMKTLMQARTLGLIDDELKEQELPAPAHEPTGPVAEDELADVEPPMVELQPVPDIASNDEVLSAPPSDEATAAGTVLPFPVRPGSADPA